MSKNTNINAINNAKFDFNAPATVTTESRGKLGEVSVWKRTWTNDKGESTEVTLTDKALVLSASRLDTLLAMREFSSLGVCYELSFIASKKDTFGFKSVGEIGAKLFGLKSSTASAYARVGRLFVVMTESGNGIHYALKPEYTGATVANLVQVLSLIDEKADDPEAQLLEAIADDKIHLNGTLANLKKEVSALKKGETIDESGDSAIEVNAKVVSEVKSSIADAIATLLAECEKVESEGVKAHALELITELQSIFTTEFSE